MKFYGYTLNGKGKATLSLMVKVEAGKGVAGSCWKAEKTVMVSTRKEVEKECERLNRELAEANQ